MRIGQYQEKDFKAWCIITDMSFLYWRWRMDRQKIILQKNKIYFFKHWENVKVYLQYIIHIHILKRIQKFADKLCFSFSVTLPKLVSRTYIYIYIYIYPHTTYTCFVLPRTHQCGSVNDERTTDVTRLLKAPGAEVCQSAYELCKYI